MLAFAMYYALLLNGVDHKYYECLEENHLHIACIIIQPSPITAPEDFDTCFRHELKCHIGRMNP